MNNIKFVVAGAEGEFAVQLTLPVRLTAQKIKVFWRKESTDAFEPWSNGSMSFDGNDYYVELTGGKFDVHTTLIRHMLCAVVSHQRDVIVNSDTLFRDAALLGGRALVTTGEQSRTLDIVADDLEIMGSNVDEAGDLLKTLLSDVRESALRERVFNIARLIGVELTY